MLPAVSFNGHFGPNTGKIENERRCRMLTTKLPADAMAEKAWP